jgi:hypothetical protein
MKLGKLPAKHDPRTLKYSAYRTGNLTAPPQAHWGRWKGMTFGMLGNDAYGDCAEAAMGHQEQMWTNDSGGTQFVPTEDETLAVYSAVTGFSQSNPNSDQGTALLDALNYWKATGFAGHKVSAYMAVSPQAAEQVRESVYFYGGAYVGIQLPLSAQAQVGSTWTVGTGSAAQAGSWGGHCVPVSGYDSEFLWVVTWGTLQAMTWEFFNTYCDEAFVALSQDWMSKSDQGPGGLAWGTLLADLANL